MSIQVIRDVKPIPHQKISESSVSSALVGLVQSMLKSVHGQPTAQERKNLTELKKSCALYDKTLQQAGMEPELTKLIQRIDAVLKR